MVEKADVNKVPAKKKSAQKKAPKSDSTVALRPTRAAQSGPIAVIALSWEAGANTLDWALEEYGAVLGGPTCPTCPSGVVPQIAKGVTRQSINAAGQSIQTLPTQILVIRFPNDTEAKRWAVDFDSHLELIVGYPG